MAVNKAKLKLSFLKDDVDEQQQEEVKLKKKISICCIYVYIRIYIKEPLKDKVS